MADPSERVPPLTEGAAKQENPVTERPPLLEAQSEVNTPSSDKDKKHKTEGDGDGERRPQPSTGEEVAPSCSSSSCRVEESGRERLKRHRVEVAGRVWIPDMWGQEELLKDWIDCSGFDACLMPTGILSARKALIEEGTRASSGGLRIDNRC